MNTMSRRQMRGTDCYSALVASCLVVSIFGNAYQEVGVCYGYIIGASVSCVAASLFGDSHSSWESCSGVGVMCIAASGTGTSEATFRHECEAPTIGCMAVRSPTQP